MVDKQVRFHGVSRSLADIGLHENRNTELSTSNCARALHGEDDKGVITVGSGHTPGSFEHFHSASTN